MMIQAFTDSDFSVLRSDFWLSSAFSVASVKCNCDRVSTARGDGHPAGAGGRGLAGAPHIAAKLSKRALGRTASRPRAGRQWARWPQPCCYAPPTHGRPTRASPAPPRELHQSRRHAFVMSSRGARRAHGASTISWSSTKGSACSRLARAASKGEPARPSANAVVARRNSMPRLRAGKRR